MSSVYNLEPPPTGKCILHTTSGDLEVELFANQAPLACRSFLQHCLDGYYDNTIFHRLVPGFILQGGDPSGTGSGGQSALEEGRPFADEFHSRLKFNRRGLLGMANGGAKNDNGSQFFLTLGKTDELNNKHTMFGRIQGDTIYNLVKMGEAELMEDGGDRPMYPVKITGAEVLVNPFEDMTTRVAKRAQTIEQGPPKKKLKKKNAKQLLSFDTEDGEETVPAPKKSKANPKFTDSGKLNLPERIEAPKAAPAVRKPAAPLPHPRRSSPSPSDSDDSEPEAEMLVSQRETSMAKANAQIEAIKQSLRRDVTAAPKEEVKKKNSLLDSFIPETATRGRKRKAPGSSNSTTLSRAEQQALDQFNAFKAQITSSNKNATAPSNKTQVSTENGQKKSQSDSADMDEDEENVCDLHFVPNCQSCKQWDAEEEADKDEDDDDTGWMAHRLTFAKDRLGKDLEWKRQNEQIMEVFDPKTREKDFKAERKKERSGGSRR